LLLFVGELARVKQTARRRRRYVAMPSSSSSAATTPTAGASSEDLSGTAAAAELLPGDTMEFGIPRISLAHVQDMQRLGYFGGGVGRVPGVEEVPEPEGELVVFEAFFIAGLRLPAHRFVLEVLQKFEVQVHQLTPNVVVVLAKYVWATTSYGGQPSVGVIAKQYCLHWQKRKIG
jgi:NAD(P)H-flavin reductase